MYTNLLTIHISNVFFVLTLEHLNAAVLHGRHQPLKHVDDDRPYSRLIAALWSAVNVNWSPPAYKSRTKMSHRFLIGFKSSDFSGQSIVSTFILARNARVVAHTWIDALSCWNTNAVSYLLREGKIFAESVDVVGGFLAAVEEGDLGLARRREAGPQHHIAAANMTANAVLLVGRDVVPVELTSIRVVAVELFLVCKHYCTPLVAVIDKFLSPATSLALCAAVSLSVCMRRV